MRRSNWKRTWDKTPEATAYRNAYNAEHYARVMMCLPPEEKEDAQERARSKGVSLTQYIRDALEAYKRT